MPVLNLPEIVVTPSTSFIPELLTPRNNDYSPYIPTANDVIAVSEAVGLGGTGATVVGACLVCVGQPEIGLPLIIAGQSVSKTADVAKGSAQLTKGDITGAIVTGGSMLLGTGTGKVIDRLPLNEAKKEVTKVAADLTIQAGKNKVEELIVDKKE
jgi:hypothetical protein